MNGASRSTTATMSRSATRAVADERFELEWRVMSNDESTADKVTDDAKAVLGCGLRTLAMWIGAVLLIAAMIGLGVWISSWFTG